MHHSDAEAGDVPFSKKTVIIITIVWPDDNDTITMSGPREYLSIIRGANRSLELLISRHTFRYAPSSSLFICTYGVTFVTPK